MKITFLGTGAADWPLVKPKDSAEFRHFSSALIDNCLLIDPGPQVIDALAEFQIDPGKIRYIINTHSHSDHFSKTSVQALTDNGARFYPLEDGESKTLGKYTVHAYKGNHGTCADTVHFIIHDGKNCIFYGLDGAWLLYDEIQAIKLHKPDIAILDGTVGEIDGDYRIFEHNNLQMVREMQKALSPYVGKFVISHLARTLHTDHSTLCQLMSKDNITVAFDGLSLLIE